MKYWYTFGDQTLNLFLELQVHVNMHYLFLLYNIKVTCIHRELLIDPQYKNVINYLKAKVLSDGDVTMTMLYGY